jgi:hypothetical protein
MTALKSSQVLAPGVHHVLVVIALSVLMTLAVIALPIATGLVVHELAGGATVAPSHGPIPEPGLDR